MGAAITSGARSRTPCQATARTTSAVVQEAVGDGASGRAIARAMSSPFGVGGARFRYSEHEQEMPTVFLGTFRGSAFERVGLFDEAYPPHEDYELNERIRSTGGRIVFSPDIRTRYHVRDGLRALARQYYRYGRGKVRVARAQPRVIRPYHLVAPALVAAIPVTAAMAVTGRGRRLALAGAAAYAGGLRYRRAAGGARRARCEFADADPGHLCGDARCLGGRLLGGNARGGARDRNGRRVAATASRGRPQTA